jgi:hypothetical protein
MSNKSELQENNALLSEILNLTEALVKAVPSTGGAMTGALTLHGDPTAPLHAATKQYVDNAIAVKVAEAVVG